MSDVISFISAGIALFGVLFVILTWYNSKKTLKNQRYLKLIDEYRSVDMFSAIQGLHTFNNKCEKEGKCIGAIYEIIKKEEEKKENKKNTLHYQRRLVSHFW